ncbi:probable 2-oxoglutarate-dependent dioxygenase At5g05600 [Chenopodium quinoa]|uniref:Fe2OG dioxygenase domain-containing protein n=1 Tax=Chenopodium quinoa TaxID=63459 RepID=A0A803LE11_CHEQI|nr:probable 2-oxoglutarate-dependent dioxygenase At5g05600 [Chenopodium quinoa]
MGDVNPDFIQPSEFRPNPTSIIEAKEIPVIDISSASDGVIAEIKEACEKWGFFQVINHGVPMEKREKAELAARKFFGLPLEEKKKVRRDEENPLGYYDSEHTKNVRDWKEIFDFTVLDPTLIPASHEIGDEEIRELRNQWPDYPPDFRAACEEYTKEMVKLSYKLLELIALSLGVPADRFSGFFEDHASFIRINYYPPCPYPDLALGVGPHKDSGALTVLAQDDVGGLEVKRKMDGAWILVKPTPDAYIINVGDVIQVWSNDKYESVEHRVKVNIEKGRLSIPFFFNPSHYVTVKPLNELIDKQNPAKYREYNYGKFYTTRRLSDFKKLNVENVQVAHFKIVE